jgi:hypothetical protein
MTIDANCQPNPRPGRSKSRRNAWRIGTALVAVLLLIPLAHFIYHRKVETFALTWYPGDSYRPALGLPKVGDHGEPRVVLVRRSGLIDCFDVLYSQELEGLLQTSPRQVNITYRISYRFGRPIWIEVLDVAGLGPAVSTSRYTVVGASYRTGDVKPEGCF